MTAGDKATSRTEGYREGTRLTGLSRERDELDVLDEILLTACGLAKDDGITVFTVSAVPDDHPKKAKLDEQLFACATSADHAFVRNSNPAGMQTAFREIGRVVQGIRRTGVALGVREAR